MKWDGREGHTAIRNAILMFCEGLCMSENVRR